MQGTASGRGVITNQLSFLSKYIPNMGKNSCWNLEVMFLENKIWNLKIWFINIWNPKNVSYPSTYKNTNNFEKFQQ
jgi:hypothetical protein